MVFFSPFYLIFEYIKHLHVASVIKLLILSLLHPALLMLGLGFCKPHFCFFPAGSLVESAGISANLPKVMLQGVCRARRVGWNFAALLFLPCGTVY